MSWLLWRSKQTYHKKFHLLQKKGTLDKTCTSGNACFPDVTVSDGVMEWLYRSPECPPLQGSLIAGSEAGELAGGGLL